MKEKTNEKKSLRGAKTVNRYSNERDWVDKCNHRRYCDAVNPHVHENPDEKWPENMN